MTFIGLLGAGLVSTGCTTTTRALPEAAQQPMEFRNVTKNAGETPKLEAWWSIFRDPMLDGLEQEALASSPSLAVVAARVEEARARLGLAKADRLLSVTASGSVRLAGETAERTLPVPGNPVRYRDSGDSYRAAFDAGYELDLWGRVKRSVESAKAQLAASESDERGARLSLSADLAQSYLLLRGLDAEALVLERNIASRRDFASLLKTRATAGYSTEIEYERTLAEISSLLAEASELRRRREQAANAIAVLTGRSPSLVASPAVASALPALPSVAPGLPAKMLARRPDLAASEFLMTARLAEIGVAEAARYPSIRLTGSAGFESPDLTRLLDRPSQFWQLGPSLSFPLFDGGRSKRNIEAAKARAEAATAEHRQRTLQALREVEDALVDLRQQAEQVLSLEQAHVAASNASRLSMTRYEAGLANYLEVLDAQRSQVQIERTQSQLASARLLSSVKLIRALGGGWDRSAD